MICVTFKRNAAVYCLCATGMPFLFLSYYLLAFSRRLDSFLIALAFADRIFLSIPAHIFTDFRVQGYIIGGFIACASRPSFGPTKTIKLSLTFLMALAWLFFPGEVIAQRPIPAYMLMETI
ncbi:hypothetical protein M413DRAFT_118538 [Hebeloma cylindrosporum]|uniref:Uncharacterized protein n=1 Tax=Hebeloma cylindrosporum TaxID=76867 RepID=A0A0C3D178_HEBCY|nr:hypothetical protein M413DRAFT_118538 [Hebeloma cylindrosporum h7]